MRILFLAPDVSLEDWDGQSVHTLALCRAFRNLGHEVLLLVGRLGSLQPEGRGVIVEEIRNTGIFSRGNALHKVRAFSPSIIYERRSTPKLGAFIASRLGLPYYLEVNGLVKREISQIAHAGHFWQKFRRRRIFSRCARIFVPSAGLADALVVAEGINRTVFSVVPNGIDLTLFQPADRTSARRSLGLPQNLLVATFVGKLAPWQGLETILAAAALLRDQPALRFFIVGDGPLLSSLQESVRTQRLSDKVVFMGSIPHESVPTILAASDVCLAPFTRARNEEIEISPLKIFEYMAMARPIVASDVPGVRALIHDCGIMIPPDSPSALAAAIGELLRNRDAAELVARRAPEFLIDCSWEARARDILETIFSTRSASA